jgi:uncharacterized membrane protein YkvA (DUF1232 family)
MTMVEWILSAVALSAAVYLGLVVVLVIAGRRADAAALARFIPDCIVLFRRLLGDSRVSRSRKLLVGLLLLYLAMPFDLVPDFVPVAGQLDDAILVGFVLRSILRHSGSALLREHWPGPEQSLAFVVRLASTEKRGRRMAPPPPDG